MKGVLASSEDAVVSTDYLGDSHSHDFDANACIRSTHFVKTDLVVR